MRRQRSNIYSSGMSSYQLSLWASSTSVIEHLNSKVSVIIEDGVVKSCVKGAVIPDVNFESYFTTVWREHEDLTALVDAHSDASCTFGELLDASRRVAAGLRRLGLRAGDVVAFHGPNSLELVFAMCGTFFAGGIGLLSKGSLTRGEIHFQLADAKPKFVFCQVEEVNEMRQACEGVASVEEIIALNGSCEEAHNFSELKETDLVENDTCLNQTPDMTLLIAYSSGTTGLPKGVQLTHRNLIAQVISFGYQDPTFERGDSLWFPSTMMHIGGFWAVFCYLGLGSKVVFRALFDIGSTLAVIQRHKPTTVAMYPSAVRQLDQWSQYGDFERSSVKKLLVGGGTVSPSVLKSIRRKLGLKELSQGYGMTELTSCVTFSTRLDDLKSVGKPTAFCEMKVVDFDTRETLGPHQQGEICVKSPAAFKAYLNQPKATADVYEDGFVRTGDRGYYTADGCFFVRGRFKELIKCMDQQVPPAELEELLAADPVVKYVIVVGIPHPQYGEAARAFVVHRCRPEDPLEEQREAERLKQLVAGRLAHHKHLHGGLEFLDSIPQTNYGKYLRNSVKMAYIERCKSAKNSGI
ncbi:uncharacterized protein LOC142569993 [Dermacentor variabilis]|uniref:uncharacterized protein LOC142569993 n=1 Tax=Dermacentor variabilis TaxID=34621 RepID=UPI003F5B4409